MFDRSKDEIEYQGVWRSVLENVLSFSQDKVELWVSEIGMPLLEKPDVVYHEEPWYWVCPQVVRELARDRMPTDEMKAETAVSQG